MTPIADGNHPNLYYDQSEIDELRAMILVQGGPSDLVGVYNDVIRGAVARPVAVNEYDSNNMAAVMSYMIEPTSWKADALKSSLLSYRTTYPDGLWDWYSEGGCHGCGYVVPWMFDLLQAYNPEKLSPSEVADLKYWFRLNAERLRINSRDECNVSGPGTDCSTYVAPRETIEGVYMSRFPNWYGRYMGPSLAAALVSGDQAAVDYWADSGWPHNLLSFDGVTDTYPADTANRYDLVTYLMAVLPSGANSDSYDREGFNLANRTWSTTSYASGPADGGYYHFAQMMGAILGAEMAFHNGMSEVFRIRGNGSEPALLRTFKKARESQYEPDLRATSVSGSPWFWRDPWNMFGYRRYSGPLIDSIPSAIDLSVRYTPELPDTRLMIFFGYPRRPMW